MDDLFFKNNPQLETERLILRKLELKDAKDIFAYASDCEVSKYMTWDTHNSIEDSKGFINFILNRYEKDDAGEWGIVLKKTGRLIGTLGFFQYDKKHNRAELGYVLGHPHWGQGIMPEAVSRLLKFAFDDIGFNRIESCHCLPNEKSGRVMQKVGMYFEGIAKEKFFAKGINWDVKQYAILKKDWVNKPTTKNITNSEIKLERANEADAEALLEVQKAAFSPLLERYQDYNFNPCSETIERIKENITRGFFYKIVVSGKLAGGIMVHQLEGLKWKLRIIFIAPEFQGLGISQAAIKEMEIRHSDINEWELETPHDLYMNHHIYEKAGYMRTKEIKPVNDKLALVHYRKVVTK